MYDTAGYGYVYGHGWRKKEEEKETKQTYGVIGFGV